MNNSHLDKLKNIIQYTDRDYKRVRNKFKSIKEMGYSKLTFIIQHKPLPAKRTRSSFRGHYYVPDAKKNKKEIRELITNQLPPSFEIIKTEIKISIKCYFPLIKNFSKVDKFLAEIGIIRPMVRPDVDNLEKTYLDAFNKFIWVDDGQVIASRVEKYYSIEPRVEIEIKYRNGFTSSIFENPSKRREMKDENK